MVVLVMLAMLLLVVSIVAAQALEQRTARHNEEARRANALRIAEARNRRRDSGRLELERRRRERAGE